MKWSERSYNAKLLRPRPLIHQDESQNFILIMTPWGSQEECQKVMEHTVQHLLTVRQDQEVTSAFQKILSLSPQANELRQVALLTNDFLFRNVNSESHELVVEFLFLAFNKRQVSWAQLGCPHLFLKKFNQGTQPISCYPETQSSLQNFPLPSYFLGSDSTIAPRCGDLYLEKNDELILLSASSIPNQIWQSSHKKEIGDWTDEITAENDSQPFWLGRLQLD